MLLVVQTVAGVTAFWAVFAVRGARKSQANRSPVIPGLTGDLVTPDLIGGGHLETGRTRAKLKFRSFFLAKNY